MRRVARVALALALPLLAAACASPQAAGDAAPMSFAQQKPAADDILKRPSDSVAPAVPGSLAGRTIRVSKVSDIRLGAREVVLTFDDGPMPGKTNAVLAALDRHGVKATFLMVGQMARAHPALVRKVAAGGHSIGSHSQNHANLRAIGFSRAINEIEEGRRSISGALGPSSTRGSVFFRFPYLAETSALRAHLASQGVVVIDSQVDSKDYFQSSPDQIRQRVLSRLGKNGSGIILMHDIHARTAAMLPGLLSDLKARGFRVVHLVPGRSSTGPLLASAE